MVRDDVDFVLDITKFKSKAAWAADPFKEVPTAVKSAFTRSAHLTLQATYVQGTPGSGHSRGQGHPSVESSMPVGPPHEGGQKTHEQEKGG